MSPASGWKTGNGCAMQDCHAMGAQPSAALVLAVVPHAGEGHQEEELFQMLAGAAGVLGEAGCQLVGGHSSEGSEPALGALSLLSFFSVLFGTGMLPAGRRLARAPNLLLVRCPSNQFFLVLFWKRNAASWLASSEGCAPALGALPPPIPSSRLARTALVMFFCMKPPPALQVSTADEGALQQGLRSCSWCDASPRFDGTGPHWLATSLLPLQYSAEATQMHDSYGAAYRFCPHQDVHCLTSKLKDSTRNC